ncbi:MAG TPA: riboflavin synthase [Gammaproteobacteria bacterium]|nr:riboflavin synthase [Gammaproteobacteria bacterium]
MFTGIVQAVGHIAALEQGDGDARIRIRAGALDLSGAVLGDSVSVSGVCLTAVALHDDGFSADVSAETRRCTTFSGLRAGDPVNLEKALTLSAPLGGHLVSGHVDGVGEVIRREQAGASTRYVIRAPGELARYIAAKGSICVDGVSLTVNTVAGAEFWVNVVPHTLAVTTLGRYAAGTRVNLEVDLVARYLERLVMGDAAAERGGVSRALLARYGFLRPDERARRRGKQT